MRPFSTFELKPFLFADESALKQLHQIFLEKSLEIHPDRLPAAARVPGSPEANLAEEKAAILNADYADLKSTDRLLKRVLMDTLGPPTAKNSLPPAFAMEYFELQEKIESLNICLGQKLPEAIQNELNSFRLRIENECEKKTQLRNQKASKFSFSGKIKGEIDCKAPWTPADLNDLQNIDFEIRFFNQFLNDLKRRFG